MLKNLFYKLRQRQLSARISALVDFQNDERERISDAEGNIIKAQRLINRDCAALRRLQGEHLPKADLVFLRKQAD